MQDLRLLSAGEASERVAATDVLGGTFTPHCAAIHPARLARGLAGRTLADLVLGKDTGLTHLPWVGHRSPAWEAEPLRWLGMNAGLRVMSWADQQEARTGRQSRLARLAGRFLGD